MWTQPIPWHKTKHTNIHAPQLSSRINRSIRPRPSRSPLSDTREISHPFKSHQSRGVMVLNALIIQTLCRTAHGSALETLPAALHQDLLSARVASYAQELQRDSSTDSQGGASVLNQQQITKRWRRDEWTWKMLPAPSLDSTICNNDSSANLGNYQWINQWLTAKGRMQRCLRSGLELEMDNYC